MGLLFESSFPKDMNQTAGPDTQPEPKLPILHEKQTTCLLYTSDAADE